MVNYKSKFAVNYIVFVLAIGGLCSLLSNVLTAVIIQVFFKDSVEEMQYIVRCIIFTLASIIVFYMGVGSAVKYASKGEDVPEYTDMKKFAIMFFSIIALVQVALSCYQVSNVMSQLEEFCEQYSMYKERIMEMNEPTLITYIICSVIVVADILLMIPVTLKKYDE